MVNKRQGKKKKGLYPKEMKHYPQNPKCECLMCFRRKVGDTFRSINNQLKLVIEDLKNIHESALTLLKKNVDGINEAVKTINVTIKELKEKHDKLAKWVYQQREDVRKDIDDLKRFTNSIYDENGKIRKKKVA